MDDSVDSVENDEEGVELYRQLKALWGIASMYARKWISNSPKVIEAIPTAERATEIVINSGQDPVIKTPGISWNSTEDLFTITASPVSPDFQTTKWNVLRKVATIFDPLGFVCPYVIVAKILLQELWMRGYDWDDEVQDEIANKIGDWYEQLKSLKEVKIPRCLGSPEPVKSKRIVTFVDASQQAYGAAVYIRCKCHNDAVTSRLIAAKTGTHGRDFWPALNTVLVDDPGSTNAERDVLFRQYGCLMVDSRVRKRLPTLCSKPNW